MFALYRFLLSLSDYVAIEASGVIKFCRFCQRVDFSFRDTVNNLSTKYTQSPQKFVRMLLLSGMLQNARNTALSVLLTILPSVIRASVDHGLPTIQTLLPAKVD